jgi:hypothetical protein
VLATLGDWKRRVLLALQQHYDSNDEDYEEFSDREEEEWDNESIPEQKPPSDMWVEIGVLQ